ncbi:MAG: 30S ribosomal protein S12 methylthiotransferase RimO [Desulfobacterales bacterium]|nr:MAG: 30S ribosomal protein S12 methylthiotransferase RimO [Desulfobacterales bacterium]
MKLHLVSLGCAKNLVDSEGMLGRLTQAGYTITPYPENAEVIIINTCSFIEPAINESIDTILELARYKKTGSCQRLVVTGCLPERFREAITDTLPEVDFFLGTGAFDQIIPAVVETLNDSRLYLPHPDVTRFQKQPPHRILSSPHLAYIKIAEGCDRHCTYCIIPKLRGRQKSRYLEDIVSEARSLASSGIKELLLIAQDTTNYGNDLNPPISLGRLLENISDISDNIWVRLLYGHPESIDESLIRTVAKHRNICSYFDIPIQHVSSSILKKMGRHYSSDDLYRLFDSIRSLVPDAAIRTTLLVGFPGETETHFKELLAFVKEVRFDHLGTFIYSDADDLPSHKFSNPVPYNIAKERYDQLMSSQLEISSQMNQKHIGNVYDVLVEETVGPNLYSGRTFFQAPEVDGTTYIQSEQLKIGAFARVRIVDAAEYDLTGEVA